MHKKPRKPPRVPHPHAPRPAVVSGGQAAGGSDSPEMLYMLAKSQLRKRDVRGALPILERAVAAAPAVGKYHELLAQVHGALGDKERAESECRLALRFDAGRERAAILLGLILLDRGEPGAALEQFLAAVEANPPCPEGLINASVALNRLGEHERAAACSQRVLAQDPHNPLAWTNLGMAHRAVGRREEARQAFLQAGDFPLARFNLGYLFLQDNDLTRGLPLLEVRRKLLGIGRGMDGRPWTGGERPEKTLVIIQEQGMGDTILMSQFLRRVRPLFRKVFVQVQRPTLRLMAGAFPDFNVISDLEGVNYDYWCPMMSLPFLLGVRDVSELDREPWLRVPNSRALGRPTAASGRLRVGLNWAGNPKFTYDAIRSTHLENLELLLQVGDVDWVSLHKGHLEGEAERYDLPQPLRHAHDFYDTAMVLAGLDLVISTETAVPNLSAALGVPTCVLSTADPDWRWGAWFPNVTVCRQQAPGNWFGALAGVLEVIQDLLRRGADGEEQTSSAA